MADNTIKMANRYGLNLNFYKYDSSADVGGYKGALAYTVEFANECALEITGDAVYATGGQGRKRLIRFDNPMEGTFTISTQVSTMPLLALVTGEDPSTADRKKVTFKNDNKAKTNYYVVEGETVYKSEDGTTYSEDIVLCKAVVNKNYSVSYSGDGDPQSIDVTFDLLENPDGEIATVERDVESTEG